MLKTVEDCGYKVGDLVKVIERYNPDFGKVGSIVSIYDDYTLEVDLGVNAMSNLFATDSVEPAKLKRVRGFEICKGYEDKAIMPIRKTKYSAGYDFSTPEAIIILPHSASKDVKTGIKAYMQDDEYLALAIRSSLAVKKGLMLVNNLGIIDKDFYDNPDNEGNIAFKFYNTTDNIVFIEAGTRVMQGIFTKYLVADNCNSDEVRTGGIGSTDKQG